jgi:hypothetical protein
MKFDRTRVRKSIKRVTDDIDAERKNAEELAKTLHVVHLSPNVAKVFEQITRVLLPGIKRVIRCPYCNVANIEGQPLCCDFLRSAIVEALAAKPEKAAIN